MSIKVENMTSLAEQTDTEHDGVQTSVANSPGKDDIPTVRGKSACLDFVNSTTLHGLRFVFLDHASLVRRLLWLGVLLTCAGLMVYQIAERVQYFLKRPVAIKMEFNYNSSLPFPAVTVCNQNSFRASFVFDEDWYYMIDNFVQDRYPSRHPNMTIDEMFRRAAHRKEDFIEGCKWGDEVCSPENFTEIFTDHGLCFTFNPDQENPLHVHSTGSANGLRLTLNIESYEEMIGPHESLGVKLLVHDQKDVPMVEALGLAVPPGSHAFVGVQLQVVDNLPPLYGECGSEPSEFFPPERHTVDSCQLSCLTSQLRQTCGCRHHFMPHVNGSPPVCTLEQFHECYLTNIANLTEIASRFCHCPVPCRSGVYNPVISVGTLSSGAVSNYIFNHEVFDRTGEILISKGKSDSFNVIHREEVYGIFYDVYTSFRLLERNLTKASDAFASNKDELLREEEMEFYNVISTRLHLLRWQEFNLARNFLVLWDEMEGTLGILLHNPWRFTHQLRGKLRRLNASSEQDALLLEAILTEEITNSIEYIGAAQGNYKLLQISFRHGAPYRSDQYEHHTAQENFFVTPDRLLWQEQMTEKELDLPTQCLENASLALESWKAMLSDIRENHTLNETLVIDLQLQFVRSMGDFKDSVIVVHSKVFQPPQDVILSEIQTSQSLQPAIELRFREHKQHLQAILKLQENMTNATIPAIEDILIHVFDYCVEENKTTKMDLARLFLENVVHIDDFQSYFGDMAAKVDAVQNNLNKLQSQMENLWESVWADRTELRKAYTYFNYTELLIDRDNKQRTLASRFDRSRELFRAMDGRGPRLKNFNDGLQTLALMMADFASEAKLWDTYVQDNIVKVDIYFRERKYEHVTQQVAYDESALLSDIGGSVGLFLGASVLTLFELIDLIIRQIIRHFTHNVPV